MSSLYPIKLSATPEAWRLFSIRKTDAQFEKLAQQIMERDKFTCQFCGFQAKQHQEIINLDNDYRNNKPANLVTSCCFCAQCFFIEAVGRDDYGGGNLIYLPEINQGDLNGFCHVLFCAMSNATNYRSEAQDIYRNLKARSQLVEKQFGEGMSDPILFGRMLIDAPEKKTHPVEIEKILKNLRLLPSYTKFSKQIEDWDRAALEELASKK